METPAQIEKNKENRRSVKSGKVKEPVKKYSFYIPELRMKVQSNNPDEQEIRNKYLRRDYVTYF